jgi:hypothetical protein
MVKGSSAAFANTVAPRQGFIWQPWSAPVRASEECAQSVGLARYSAASSMRLHRISAAFTWPAVQPGRPSAPETLPQLPT